MKKNSFEWTKETQAAFDELKKLITTGPVLTLPDFSQPFVVECDTFGKGVGAVLMQRGWPIAYFCKALADQTLSKSAYEKELLAVVLAIQH